MTDTETLEKRYTNNKEDTGTEEPEIIITEILADTVKRYLLEEYRGRLVTFMRNSVKK